MTRESLCETCVHRRLVVSGTGSRFLLCRLSQTDDRYPKYPPQPVVTCAGYVAEPPGKKERTATVQ